jgi:hypothetical protein
MLSGKSIVIDGNMLPTEELIAYFLDAWRSELHSDWKCYCWACLMYQHLLGIGDGGTERGRKSPFSIDI